jgi:hypothetical protein
MHSLDRPRKRQPRDPIVIPGPSIAYIPLTQGMFALIDLDDAKLLVGTRWFACWYASSNGFYACRNRAGRVELLHRFLMMPGRGLTVDHRNRVTLDCRRSCNLRIATHSQNRVNSDGKTSVRHCGCKGVCFSKQRRAFEARIQFNGHRLFLGRFASEAEAAAAYEAKAHELHGEFARVSEVAA